MKNSFKISKLINKVILARTVRKKIRGEPASDEGRGGGRNARCPVLPPPINEIPVSIYDVRGILGGGQR